MTKQEYREAFDQLVYLVGCAAGNSLPDRRRIEGMNLDRVLEVAQKHMLASAAGMALEKAGIEDGRFANAVAMAQRKDALLDADRAAVLAKLEEAGIWYMPLKGAVLKDLYPRFGMREMSDNDILFDKSRAGDVRAIMEGLGFTTVDYGKKNHDVYRKKPASNFEMHTALFSETSRYDLHPYWADVKDRLIKDEGNGWGYHFSNEDFYLYITAHEYKHYSVTGTGLRSILDTYVFLSRRQLDMEYVRREAGKIGILDFERQNRSLATHLFGGEPLTDGDRHMLEFIASAGTYGDGETYAADQVKLMGRWSYFKSRMLLPMELMKGLYPVLKKAPFLYPACAVHRLLRGLFRNNAQFRRQLGAVLGQNRDKDE